MKKEYKICKWTQPMSFISYFMYQTTYTEVEKIYIPEFENELTLVKHNGSETYVIGQLVEVIEDDSKSQEPVTKFEIYLKIFLNKEIEYPDYDNLFYVNEIHSMVDEKHINLSIYLFKWFISKKYLIIGNNKSYFGNKRIWSKISTLSDILIDSINPINKQLVNQNIILNRGNGNDETWGYQTSNELLLLILKNII
jgi:hypothetical protein